MNMDGLTVINTRVDVGDDCFAPKPNTSNIFVQNLWCNNTHGVSMGSIGQYPGVLDYIEHAHIENVTLLNGQVRIQNPKPYFHFEQDLTKAIKIERRPPEGLGRSRGRLRPHPQHHLQGHPHRKHRRPRRPGPMLLRHRTRSLRRVPISSRHHRYRLRKHLRHLVRLGRPRGRGPDLLSQRGVLQHRAL